VVAFFPGSFTPPCREEMCNFRDDMNEFNDLGAEVVAVSVDTPFAQKEFADQNDLNFRLVSDTAKEIVEQYGVKTVFPDTGHEIAERAVFLVSDGEVVYREVMDDPHNLPDMEELKEAIEGL
jgi:peroxiredoxin